MKASILRATPALLAVAALAAASGSGRAQQAPPRAVGPATNWGSIFVVGYPGIGAVTSPIGPESGTDTQKWDFGSGVGLGVAAAHVLGPALQLGIDASFAPSVGVDITDNQTGTLTQGQKAKIGHVMATGRIMTGGGGGLGLFLAGGVGAMFFGMPDPATSATDFAFRYGGGLEYQWTPRRAVFLEWGSIGAFHKHHGASSNTFHFSQIRGGLRIGW